MAEETVPRAAFDALVQQIAALQATIERLTAIIEEKNQIIQNQNRARFGQSSEKRTYVLTDGQLSLFGITGDGITEKTADNEQGVSNDGEKEVPVAAHKRKAKRTLEELCADLPVEEIIADLPEDEKYTADGRALKYIGMDEVRTELVREPSRVYVRKYYCKSYADPQAEAQTGCADIRRAQTPAPLLEHSYASASVVTDVIMKKYADALPLYRQEQIWKREGVELKRGTMANWVIECSLRYLVPVYERLHQYLLQRDILHADEVPCQVLKEEGRPAQAKSYMWIYLTGNDSGPGIVLYDYRPGRKGQYAKEFLEGFHGYCHCDGYSGYNTPEDIERVGCYAHLRRKFFDAIPVKKEAGGAMLPAEVGVAYCDRLFLLEREYRGITAEERRKVRIEKEKPVVDALYRYLGTLHPVKGSKLAAAVTYAMNQRANLMNYFKDGRLELSNNAAERRAKSYVIGRKNFLFHDTVDGAKASAVVYSLVETAKANGLSIYHYLYLLLLYMPDYINEPDGIEDMMPWSEFMMEQCHKADQKEKEMEPVKRK